MVDILDDDGLLHHAKVALGGDVRPWIGDLDKIFRKSGWAIIFDVTLVYANGALDILDKKWDSSASVVSSTMAKFLSTVTSDPGLRTLTIFDA